MAAGTGTQKAPEAVLTTLTAISIGTMVPLLAFALGLLIVLPIVFVRWRELYRWLPRHQRNSADRLESLFLLYTPLRRRALIFHALFHALLLFLYLFLGFHNSMDVYWVSFLYAVPFALFTFGVRWLARQVSM